MRAVVAIVEGMDDLRHQSAQLMATLTYTGWGNSVLPALWEVSRNVAMDCGTTEEAAIVI